MTSKPSKSEKTKAARKRLPRALVITLRILRHLLIPILCCIALLAGLSIGYVKLGGQPFADVWKLDTWKHLIDLVFANT
ncbi:DNA-directed RNA polymerase subunit beta [Paenibacillus sp. MBLB4367]|uniref:DNA-directed RNA polymerase subunit beta n=1 Tax=Paenibacillus sp. MBLB4367 TaxID=3384767 RepID=UPI00390807EE